MRREVWDERGEVRIRIDSAEPVCGKHFCDTCGCCLACYANDGCCPECTPECRWVVYGEAKANGA